MYFSLNQFIFFFLVGSPKTYILHQELLNFVLVAMSTQLLSGPTPGPKDVNPFIDAAMDQVWDLAYWLVWNLHIITPVLLYVLIYWFKLQDVSLISSVVRKLLLNYISRPRIPLNSTSYSYFSEGGQSGVLHRVGSAAGMLIFVSPFLFCNFLFIFKLSVICASFKNVSGLEC